MMTRGTPISGNLHLCHMFPLAEDKQMIREFVRKNLLDLAKETLSGGEAAIIRCRILRCLRLHAVSNVLEL